MPSLFKQSNSIAGSVLATSRFRALFIALAGTLDHPLYSYGRARLERLTDESVQSQLHRVLIGKDRPNASFLRERAWEVVEPLLQLTEAEREFTDRIQGGDLAPELLFPDDPEITDRLRRHPALLWKVENARTRPPA